jgi:hypothetical protein
MRIRSASYLGQTCPEPSESEQRVYQIRRFVLDQAQFDRLAISNETWVIDFHL